MRQSVKLTYYSWPLYLTSLVIILVSLFVLFYADASQAFKIAISLVLALTSWLTISSIIGFMWMYDLSTFPSCKWIEQLQLTPNNCLQINTGLEQTRLNLKLAYPEATHQEFDIFDHDSMSSPPINRARKSEGLTNNCTPYDSIPLKNGWSNATFIVLSAHEIRNSVERDKMFNEAIRKTEKGGHIILVEHIRDLFNTIVFGPGVFHFYGHKLWINLDSRFAIEHQTNFSATPFFRIYKFKVH